MSTPSFSDLKYLVRSDGGDVVEERREPVIHLRLRRGFGRRRDPGVLAGRDDVQRGVRVVGGPAKAAVDEVSASAKAAVNTKRRSKMVPSRNSGGPACWYRSPLSLATYRARPGRVGRPRGRGLMLAAVSGAVATYASFLAILGSATLIGQAIFIACGRRRWTRLSPAVGLAALCPLAWWTVRLPAHGTAAIVALGADHGDRRLRRLQLRRGPWRRASPRGPARALRRRHRLAAVHRRGPLRDPRHRPQPRHVPAPVRGRPARRRGERAADRRRLSARPALDRDRGLAARAEHRPRLRRADAGDGRRRLPRRPRAAGAPSRVAADRRRPGHRVRLPGRLVPHPGRVQGDDRSALPACLRRRDRPGRARVGVGSRRAAAPAGGAARRARRRRRLRVQLPRGRLARRPRWSRGSCSS